MTSLSPQEQLSPRESPIISGIQQMGVGIPKVEEAFAFYKQHFGMSVALFDDEGTAELMLPYTNGLPQNRRAILALNMKGGGGMEIWQYTTRKPLAAPFSIRLGDLGLYICKIKSDDVCATYRELKAAGVDLLHEPQRAPNGSLHFFLRDPYGNLFEVMEGLAFFGKGQRHTGGVAGACIGVSHMDAAMRFYKDVLGFDQVLSDSSDTFDDLAVLDGGRERYRRVLLTHSQARQGSFSRLLGAAHIELFQALDYSGKKMYEGRQWGDLGFIHLCFDVKRMDALRLACESMGYPFTVDSGGNFDMGEAAGRFAYLEDPDGTLIELVETYKIPIAKKIGWYIDLRRRKAEKALPNWLLSLLRFA